jgi:hypothetical protein
VVTAVPGYHTQVRSFTDMFSILSRFRVSPSPAYVSLLATAVVFRSAPDTLGRLEAQSSSSSVQSQS